MIAYLQWHVTAEEVSNRSEAFQLPLAVSFQNLPKARSNRAK